MMTDEDFAKLAFAAEDLDSDDYGMRCHWCGGENDTSDEWRAWCARMVAEKERLQEVDPRDNPFYHLKTATENVGPFTGLYAVTAHKEDCPYILYRAVHNESN